MKANPVIYVMKSNLGRVFAAVIVIQITALLCRAEAQYASSPATTQTFPVGTQPWDVAFDGASIWVVNSGEDTVTKLRASDGAAEGTFATGDFPRAILFDGVNIWIINSYDSTVTKLRASDGALLGTFLDFISFGDALAYDGTYIWCGSALTRSTVSKLLASDGTYQGFVRTDPIAAALLVAAGKLWVAAAGGNSVESFRLSDLRKQQTTAVGLAPGGLAFDGRNVWVANGDSDFLSVLRAKDGTVQRTIPASGNPAHIISAAASMWVTQFSSDTASKFRVSTGALEATYPVGDGPIGLAFDGTSIWVANYNDNTVTKVTE